jgi:hypothetical protein
MVKNGPISGESQVYLLLRKKETRDSSTTQGKTVMKMTPEAFHTWSQRLRLSFETEALIASIRSSPPVRRVSGRANCPGFPLGEPVAAETKLTVGKPAGRSDARNRHDRASIAHAAALVPPARPGAWIGQVAGATDLARGSHGYVGTTLGKPNRSARNSSQVRFPSAWSGARLAPARYARAA